MNDTDDLGHVMDVRLTRESLARERHRWEHGDHGDAATQAVALAWAERLETALATDPTVALGPARLALSRACDHLYDLAVLTRFLSRGEQDPRQAGRRAEAAAEHRRMRRRLERQAGEVEARVCPEWRRPEQRRRIARTLLPSETEVAQALERVQGLCGEAREVAPDLPEAHRVAALAQEIARTLHAGPARTCAAPRCHQPLPEEEAGRGRERRYCSPSCRRRAKR